ncbi:MAG: HepT-like ribonuclease domain-containing protein [Candidatus Thorarchaeota archaeon]
MQDDKIRFQHILDAVKEILMFTEGKGRTDLDNDRLLALGIVKLLEIIGEAATGLSRKVQSKFSTLPLRQMIGMRNRLIHGYFDIDLDIIWQTVKKDLPPLKDLLEVILKEY